MEASAKWQEFSSLSVSDLSSSPSIPLPAVIRVLDFDESAAPQLRFMKSDVQDVQNCSILIGVKIAQIFKLSSVELLCVSEEESKSKETSSSRAFRIGFETEEESKAFHSAFELWIHRNWRDSLFKLC